MRFLLIKYATIVICIGLNGCELFKDDGSNSGPDKLPLITEFILKSNSATYIQQINVFLKAEENIEVSGWLINESSLKPEASSNNWLSQKPESYTLSDGPGLKTVYAWIKDVQGNVSDSASIQVTYKPSGNGKDLVNTRSVEYEDSAKQVVSSYKNFIWTIINNKYLIEQSSNYNDNGPDNIWFTDDDILAFRTYVVYGTDENAVKIVHSNSSGITNYVINEFDENGYKIKYVTYEGAGEDGAWFTNDDEIDDYHLNIFSDNYEKEKSISYYLPGDDGTWFTEDDDHTNFYLYEYNNDNLIKYTYYNNLSEIVNYVIYDYFDNGYLRRKANYNWGENKIWFDDDDELLDYGDYSVTVSMSQSSYVYEYDELDRRSKIFNYKGGIGFNDENIFSYEKNFYYDNDMYKRRVHYSGKGEDGAWDSSDDIVTDYFEYIGDFYTSDNGSNIFRIVYDSSGDNYTWFDGDDNIVEYFKYVVKPIGDKNVYYASGSYIYVENSSNSYCYDIERGKFTEAGYDGNWLTSDDVVSEYFNYIVYEYSVY